MKKLLYRSLAVAMMLGASVAVIDASAQAPQEGRPEKMERRGEHRGEHKMDRFKNMTVAERVEKRLTQMDKQLDLSDAQVTQLRAILTEDMTRMQNAREAMKAARTADKAQDKSAHEAARAEMKAQMQTTKDRVAAVLNAEQRAKAETHMKEGRAKVREHMKERKQMKHEKGEKLRHEKKNAK